MNKRYLGCILPGPEKDCQIEDAKSAVATILSSKNTIFFCLVLFIFLLFVLCNHLSYIFKIFIDEFAFLYVKPNSNEICDGICSPFFKKKLMSAFLLSFKANYIKKYVATSMFLRIFQ